MTSRNGLPTITTYTGKTFDFLKPDPKSICIEDIAHALSQVCRFAGQSLFFYSVAQHCVLVSQHVKAAGTDKEILEIRKVALLHDAAEAYVGDVSRPLKKLLPAFSKIEHRVHRAIAKRFKLFTHEDVPVVKEADFQIFANEGIAFMGHDFRDCHLEPDPAIPPIRGLLPQDAEMLFLKRYLELFGK